MGKGGGCSFTASSFPRSGGFGKRRSVCSWVEAGRFKANRVPTMDEADRTVYKETCCCLLNICVEVGQSPVAACGHSLWHFEVKSRWIRGSKKKKSKWSTRSDAPLTGEPAASPLTLAVGASAPHPWGCVAREHPPHRTHPSLGGLFRVQPPHGGAEPTLPSV